MVNSNINLVVFTLVVVALPLLHPTACFVTAFLVLSSRSQNANINGSRRRLFSQHTKAPPFTILAQRQNNVINHATATGTTTTTISKPMSKKQKKYIRRRLSKKSMKKAVSVDDVMNNNDAATTTTDEYNQYVVNRQEMIFCENWQSLGNELRNTIRFDACKSIQNRGQFCLALGSSNDINDSILLDLLWGTATNGGGSHWWTSKTTLISAQHHFNDIEDSVTNTMATAWSNNNNHYSTTTTFTRESLLRDEWVGTKAIVPDPPTTSIRSSSSSSSNDDENNRKSMMKTAAANYVRKIRALPLKTLPRLCNSGRAKMDVPVLDLVVLMIRGDHDKLYYPMKDKRGPWVVPTVAMEVDEYSNDNNNEKNPGAVSSGIMFSLPVLQAAKRVIVVEAVDNGNSNVSDNQQRRRSILQRTIPKATWIRVLDTTSQLWNSHQGGYL